uniref:Uncharacterized protein n=1 Tax=Panagrolaimus davidi TaxID=227884 RepID=A0A914PU31_9BILA
MQKFNVVSGAFAEITKDLIDVSIAAIYCADEIANGDSEIRTTLIEKVQSQLREIFSVSKTYVKMLLEDFLVYQTLTGMLRLHIEKHYGQSMIPTESYNKTAADIRHYLDIRGYGFIFYQVVIVENNIYGKEMEIFSFTNVTKTAYIIGDIKGCHIFITRYNAIDKIDDKARTAQQYILANKVKITDAIA